VTLTSCRELSTADWIVHSELPWHQLVGFGPAGFDAYARLRFLPDPARPGQSENDVEADGRTDQLLSLFAVLATHTATPEDCYFCVWDGFADANVNVDDDAVYIDDENAGASLEPPGVQPGLAPQPAGSPSMPHVPKVVVPNRAYWLFRGPLAEVCRWDTAQGWPGQYRLQHSDPPRRPASSSPLGRAASPLSALIPPPQTRHEREQRARGGAPSSRSGAPTTSSSCCSDEQLAGTFGLPGIPG